MRKFRAALLSGVVVAGLLAGPAASSVGAQSIGSPLATYAGWTCHVDGSGVASPTTNLSGAALYEDPTQDAITCLFRGYAPKGSPAQVQFGGECYFQVPNGPRIDFAMRLWIVQNGDAKLTCRGGTIEQQPVD